MSAAAVPVRIGIDVGGTFTDGVAVNEQTGDVTTAKRFTNHGDLTSSVLDVVASLVSGFDDDAEVSGVFHGTTLATNALVERKTPAVGLLCTGGFRDILTTRRTRRQYLYDTDWDKPADLVRRMLRREVDERVDFRGEVVRPLDEDSVRREVDFLVRNGVRDFAVIYLYSFLNPVHEQRTEELIREVVPDAQISLSSVVIPEQREFERTTTTVLNAMVGRLIERYIGDLGDGVRRQGIEGPLEIMKANGGVASPASIARRPIETYQSGPAAGVTAALRVGRLSDRENLITFDVGGTTSDVSVIHAGAADMSLEEELEWSIPVHVPMIRTRSVGSGGGSIAWVDNGGALRVGPRSAGSEPGPACYARGGSEPTVTDANLILGRIAPELLGGNLELDLEAARAAIERAVASPFGWSVVEAANAIAAVATMDMVHLIREVSVNRGHDPRDFALICFGGAGGLHAVEVARELEMLEVILPSNPGVFSAAGCLFADVRHEFVQTFNVAANPPPLAELDARLAEMRELAAAEVRRDRARASALECRHRLHLRYHGEAYSIPVELGEEFSLDLGEESPPEVAVSPRDLESTIADFHEAHARLYGFAREDPVEIVDVALTVTLPLPKPHQRKDRAAGDLVAARKGSREVYVDGMMAPTPVYDRARLRFADRVAGPAVLEEANATFVVPPGSVATVDEYGAVRIGMRGDG